MPARQLRSLRPAYLLVGLGLLAFAGCSSSGSTAPAVTHPTMIEVAPEDFLGDVPCSDGPGLKRYVATLIDTDYRGQGGTASVAPSTSDDAGGAPVDFQLPSSGPTPCLAGVGFGLVVAGRRYDVKIDGYDTDDLAPRASGSRQMVSPAPSQAEPLTALLTPRWSAHCEDAIAVDSTIVRADHCTPFAPVDAGALGSVRIPLATLQGGLVCGTKAGQIDHFEISLAAGTQPPLQQTIPCTADAEAVFSGVPPRARSTANVTAFSAQSVDAFAGASCDAFSLPGATVDAECGQLSQVGTLRVDLKAALALLGLACSASSISTLTVDVPGEAQAQSLLPPECLQPFERGFAPGDRGVVVTAQPLDVAKPAQSVTCGATVAPGQLVLAKCDSK